MLLTVPLMSVSPHAPRALSTDRLARRVVFPSVFLLMVFVIWNVTQAVPITFWPAIAGTLLLAVVIRMFVHQRAENRRLAQVAACDPVTAISHRQAFATKVQRVLSQSGVMILLDIDDFRRVNDRHGRDVGDLCLRALAQRIRELTRATDVIGRLDGPCFGVYLPGAMMRDATDIAQRLSDGLMVVVEGRTLRMTTSVGVVFADGGTALDRLIFAAERALDRAKLQGRARVEVDVTPFAA